jgi:hypothetical protein
MHGATRYDEFTGGSDNAGGSAKMAKLLRIMRIMKLVRLFKLGPLMRRLKETMFMFAQSALLPGIKIIVMIMVGVGQLSVVNGGAVCSTPRSVQTNQALVLIMGM